MSKNATTIAVIVIAAGLGVWGYIAYEKQATRMSIIALVKDSSARLRSGLLAQLTAPAAGLDFEANARAGEANVAALRGMKTSPVVSLADAADAYLVTAREILRRQAYIRRAQESLAKSMETLTQHVQTDRGAASWTQEAVRLRESLDKDFRDYRLAAEACASLLESFPAAQASIALHVDRAVLIDVKIAKDARESLLSDLARADEKTKQVTRLDAYRGRR